MGDLHWVEILIVIAAVLLGMAANGFMRDKGHYRDDYSYKGRNKRRGANLLGRVKRILNKIGGKHEL